ncbi:hypothetical protein RA2_04228 [Roseovarius sp. A-2]|nr:hypothetical protein RA2_04228 [Roseovarius sp. A-2]
MLELFPPERPAAGVAAIYFIFGYVRPDGLFWCLLSASGKCGIWIDAPGNATEIHNFATLPVNKEIKRRTNVVGVRRENSAPRCFLILLTPEP